MQNLAPLFLQPRNPNHRQYEALRALAVDGLSLQQAAQQFGYAPQSLRNLLRDFRHRPHRDFFLPSIPGRKPHAPPQPSIDRDQRILALRRERQLSILEIVDQLAREGLSVSKSLVAKTLHKAGIPKLPRRSPQQILAASPLPAPLADRRLLDLRPRSFRTTFGGLFLFAPRLASLPLNAILRQASMPGSDLIPARSAVLALLALKLYGIARKSHVSADTLDPGLALFCGLNAVPKRSTLTEYSCRIDPRPPDRLATLWLDAFHDLGLPRGQSFDLDFHTIPYHGDDALVQKHYVSKRSRRQKGMLAFLARDADSRVFCYTNAAVRKPHQNDEILRFAAAWKDRSGRYPCELVFDSTLTTYANLAQLDELGIGFLTLRRRTKNILAALAAQPATAWKRVRLTNIGRRYRNPLVLEQSVSLSGFGPRKVRQIAVRDLGHDKPILLLSNRSEQPVADLIDRYARRMLIENAIADAIDFFHMDALSSQVPLKVDADLDLTLMASTLYRMLGRDLGGDYTKARARTLFRKFVQASARVEIRADGIDVRLGRRAHNPLLIAAGYADQAVPIPWLEKRPLRIVFP